MTQAEQNTEWLSEIIDNLRKTLRTKSKPADYKLEKEVIAKIARLEGQLLELRNWVNGD